MDPRIPFALFALAALGAGCSNETEAAGHGEAPAGAAARRSNDPRARALRLALDLGQPERARPLLRELEADLGLEAQLCAARLAVLDAQPLAASRLVEEARERDPADPRVWATAAELHAAAGRLQTARDELKRGIERCGRTPELLRAQAVHQLCSPGGARGGVELLVQALARDPELPFCERPLAQGHLLLAKRALADGDGALALDHASRSLERDPADVEARRFLSDALAAGGDLGAAAEVLRLLVDEGQPLQAELALLYKRAGMAGLLQRRRDEAIELFRLARDLGLDPEELGTGATILADAARQASEAGVGAYEAGDMAGARERLERALALDPDLLAARNHLAVVLFRQEDFEGAAAHWHAVVAVALAEGIELPGPVHLNLAKAEYRAGRVADARRVLQDYLVREPEGLWVPDTRFMLEKLDG